MISFPSIRVPDDDRYAIEIKEEVSGRDLRELRAYVVYFRKGIAYFSILHSL
jgi:hypothetical protein